MKFAIFLTISLLLCLNNFTCQEQNTKENLKNKESKHLKSIEKVLEEHTQYLMNIPGVVGTAIGECDDEPCIKVLVNTLNEELEMKIPSSIEGYTVVIEEVGDIKAF